MTILTQPPPQIQSFRRQSPPLGTTTSIASFSEKQDAVDPQPVERENTLKYKLQDMAAELLPGERVSGCMRSLAPINPEAGNQAYTYQTVEIHHTPGANRAWFQNLMVCGSVWTCPVCAGKITEQRRSVLAGVLERSGAYPVMMTITLRHHKKHALADRLKVLSAAYRRLTSGRWFQSIKAEFGLKGNVAGLEVTHTDANGWHPHKHVLMLFSERLKVAQIENLQHQLKLKWIDCLGKEGGNADYAHGCELTYGADLWDYVAKYGQETIDTSSWGLEHEVTKSNVKVKKEDKKGSTPFQMLADYANGDGLAGKRFREYAKATKGRNQLTWSSGWLSALRAEIEQELEEKEQVDDSHSEMLVELSKDDWRLIKHHEARGQVLHIAATQGTPGAIYDFLASLPDPWRRDRKVIRPPRSGWRLARRE